MTITDVKKIDTCEKCYKNKPEYLVRYTSGILKTANVKLLCKPCLDAAKAKEEALKG